MKALRRRASPAPTSVRQLRARTRYLRRAFPGEPAVWLSAAVVGLLLFAYAAYKLLDTGERLTGTNSVGPLSVIANVKEGERACLGALDVPKGSERVEVYVGFPEHPPQPTIEATLDGRRLAPVTVDPVGGFRQIAIPRRPHTRAGTLCLTPRGGTMDLGGASVQRLPGERDMEIAGKAVPGLDASARFLGPGGERSTLLSTLPAALARATRFRPGGAWLGWLVLLTLPALAYAALRLLATAGSRSPRALVLGVAGVALGTGVAFALSTPMFQGPDESEHFAAAQYLAETGEVVARTPDTRPPYSTEQVRLLGALHHNSSITTAATRVRWEPVQERRWRAVSHAAADDGGGYTTSASGHSPLYYGLLAPAYAVASKADMTWQVTLMRLMNALLACGIAACVVLTVRELLPNRPLLAATAGLIAAFQPMLAFMAGAINNDTAVNLAAALCLYGAVRALRRGLTWKLAAALGAGIGLLPLAKVTGYGVVPALVLALALVLIRERSRAAAGRVAVAVAAFGAVALAWTQVIGPLFGGNKATLATTGGGSAGEVSGIRDPVLLVDYLLQTFVPFIHLRGDHWLQKWPFYDVYVKRGWGSFGWVAIEFPRPVFLVITAAMAGAGVMALVAAARYRDLVRARWPAALVLAVAVLGVVALVAAAYATDAGTRLVPGEQGRYAFPGVVPLAALAALACAALGRRLEPVLAGGLVCATVAAGLAGWGVMMAGFYT